MRQALPMPMDVKMMNMTASVLYLTFALALLAALVGWASRHPVFAVRGITVTGEVTHNNALTLRANVAHKLKGTFFTLDIDAARLAFEAVPWVRKAVVRRQFPNRLQVQLQEHHAVAYWGVEGESRLLNRFGEVFEANVGEIEQETVPRLIGPDGQAVQVLAMYQTLEPMFDRLDLTIEQVELTGHGGWRLRLDTGAAVELGAGAGAEIMARTERFIKTLTQVTSQYGRKPDALESADLRHLDGYAIRLRGVTTVALDQIKK